MGRPKYILLVRHGESAANSDKSVNRHTPNHKVELTSKGVEQAQAAGKVLRQFLEHESFDQPLQSETNKCPSRSLWFYTSPYVRARETCRNICAGIDSMPNVTYKIHEEPRMREQDFGNFQSTAEEMEAIWEERAHYGHFFYRIPHGESAADVYDRVASFNETLFRKFQSDDFPNVLVLVTHGIWARVFLMKWFRWTYEEFESLKNIPHCQYLIMKRGDDGRYALKTRLETWNDVPDDEVECSIAKEVKNEVCFNSEGKVAHPEDMDIKAIIDAQKDAIMSLRDKNRRIKELYSRVRDHSPLPPHLVRNQSPAKTRNSFLKPMASRDDVVENVRQGRTPARESSPPPTQ
ncbi:hypothetical protein DICA4_D07954 [Diutina catenulata]